MIEISGQPILFHIMNYFSKFSVKEFTITLGYQGNIIKDWLRNFEFNQNSFHIDLNSGETSFIESKEYQNWSVLALDTGLNSLTASRVRQAIENSNDELNRVMFIANRFKSDFNNPMSFECNGLIAEYNKKSNNWKMLVVPTELFNSQKLRGISYAKKNPDFIDLSQLI